jgi:hypothetical protein
VPGVLIVAYLVLSEPEAGFSGSGSSKKRHKEIPLFMPPDQRLLIPRAHPISAVYTVHQKPDRLTACTCATSPWIRLL